MNVIKILSLKDFTSMNEDKNFFFHVRLQKNLSGAIWMLTCNKSPLL